MAWPSGRDRAKARNLNLAQRRSNSLIPLNRVQQNSGPAFIFAHFTRPSLIRESSRLCFRVNLNELIC